jgi:acetoacetyl-CoA synthetase
MLDLLNRSNAPLPVSLNSMMSLWERLLNVSPVAADDNFFDLGGDSLLALQLFHDIERMTGRALPITAMYEASTPRQLVDLLEEARTAPFSPLVPLKAGTGDPLYLVHGIGGNVIELRKLGQAIDTPRPVYGIQARGVDGTEAPLKSVFAMVEYYLPHLRALQPQGPYFFAGYSFGGIVAMELARRLRAEGETVALLGFIDSFPHPHYFPRPVRQMVRLHMATDAFRTLPFGAACAAVLSKLRGRGGGWGKPPTNFDEHGANAAAIRHVYDQALEALIEYRPHRYTGTVVFFRPDASIFPVAPRRVWGKLLGGLAIHRVAGDHGSMLRQHVGDLAAALTGVLRAAAAAR